MVPDLACLAIGGPRDRSSGESSGESSVGPDNVASLPRIPFDTIDKLFGKPGMVEFTVENPGIDSRVNSLWSQPYVVQWLDMWKGLVRVVPTTYCQYAHYPECKQPNKPTSIMTTLASLSLEQPCTKSRPCPELCDPRSDGRHSVQVSQREREQTSLSQCEKNAIPERLIHQVLAAWIGSKWTEGYRTFLVVDVFAGWGSVKKAAATFANSPEAMRMVEDIENSGDNDYSDLALRRILAVSNPFSLLHYVGFDAVDQRLAFRAPTTAETRYDAAHDRKRKRVGVYANTKYIGDYMDTANPILNIIGAELTELTAMGMDRVAVWVHASPPCTTFSTAGLAVHRPVNGPPSSLANEHDELVKKLLAELAMLAQLRIRNLL